MTAVEGTTVQADQVEELAAEALRWLVASARESEDGGIGWASTRSADETDPTLYSGTAGVIAVLLEAWRHFGDDAYADLASRAARSVASAVDGYGHDSLYFGRTGLALALRVVQESLGDTGAGVAADRALGLVREHFDGRRWNEFADLMGGNAGIGLGALEAGDADLAVLALEPFLEWAEKTPYGVTWAHRLEVESRLHHMSHGALGIAYALARTGRATGRTDLVALALEGAADTVGRDQDGPDGFLVVHSTPQYRPEVIEPVSYGWCHGPAGDAQLFRLLRDLDGDPAWAALADRCWHTVTRSGIPQRLRPGFWDNNGRCCGTSGVLALACDRLAEGREAHDFAEVLVADLAARAIRDADGARWSNVEHRATPSDLEPRTDWAQGSAGIVRELLRYVRISRGGDPTYAFTWPDQPAVALR